MPAIEPEDGTAALAEEQASLVGNLDEMTAQMAEAVTALGRCPRRVMPSHKGLISDR